MRSFSRYLLALLFLLSLLSCVSTKVGNYDPVMDQTFNEMQQDLSGFFIEAVHKVGTPEFAFAKYQKFYDKLQLEMATLRVRSNAVNGTGIADQEVQALDDNVSKLEALHKAGIGSAAEIKLLQSAFEHQLAAMLRLQIGLKARPKH